MSKRFELQIEKCIGFCMPNRCSACYRAIRRTLRPSPTSPRHGILLSMPALSLDYISRIYLVHERWWLHAGDQNLKDKRMTLDSVFLPGAMVTAGIVPVTGLAAIAFVIMVLTNIFDFAVVDDSITAGALLLSCGLHLHAQASSAIWSGFQPASWFWPWLHPCILMQ